MSAIFTTSVNMKFVCLGGTSGMVDFVFTCYKSLIFSDLSIINVLNFESEADSKFKYEKGESELCLNFVA